MPALIMDVSLPGAMNTGPLAGVVADAAGNLYGTCLGGGTHKQGFVFELPKTAAGYASAVVVLANLTEQTGGGPEGELLVDARGNLIGTAHLGGANKYGTVFELVRSANGFRPAPVVLVNFNYTNGAMPYTGLIADAAGNLYGTTGFGGTAGGNGTVFELAATATGYASAPITLVNFDANNGAGPLGRLLMDKDGNLLGTTSGGVFEPALPGGGPAGGDGTAFEVAKTATGYSTTMTVLAWFSWFGGATPTSGLTADPAGSLYGAMPNTSATSVSGEVYTVPHTAAGYTVYKSYPPDVARFRNSVFPYGPPLADAAGNLFGTTLNGGKYNHGTIYKLARTATGYAKQTTVFSFDGANGDSPVGALIADAKGVLYGTTELGGANNGGTVFAVRGVGFVTTAP